MATWLDDYLEWTKDSESPTWYHKWVAATVMAHALGRRVFFAQPIGITYPGQMLTLLVGRTGVQKSTAANKGYQLLCAAKHLAADGHRLNPMPQRMSNESFFDALVPEGADPEHHDCVGFLFASELSSVISKNHYMEEIPDILTDVYDAAPGTYDPPTRSVVPGYWTRRFRKDGQAPVRLKNPAITLLGCTTPVALRESLPPQVRVNGFLARLMTVYAERSDRPDVPHAGGSGAEEHRLRSRLVEGLAWATALEAEASFTEEAATWHAEWYFRMKRRLLNEGNELIAGFMARSQAHILRLAMVFAAINALGLEKLPSRLWIEASHVKAATAWVTQIEHTLPDVFGELTQDRRGRLEERILTLLGKLPPKKWLDWHRMLVRIQQMKGHYRSVEVQEMIERLVTIGRVKRDGETLIRAQFRLRTRKPGPWSGKPSLLPPSAEYLQEQEEADLLWEIKEMIRDKEGNLLSYGCDYDDDWSGETW